MNDPLSTRNTPCPTHESQTANMTSSDKVLVYHHRHNASNAIIPNGLAVLTTSELEDILQNRKCSSPNSRIPSARASHANKTPSTDPELQRSSKPISRGSLTLEIYERDLLTEVQKPQFAGLPNYTTNVAGVTVPLKVFLGKLVGSKEFGDLAILSAKR
jgi:hypothetical protein